MSDPGIIKHRRFTADDDREVFKLLDRGVRASDIARRLDPPADPKAIQHLVRKLRAKGITTLAEYDEASTKGAARQKSRREPKPKFSHLTHRGGAPCRVQGAGVSKKNIPFRNTFIGPRHADRDEKLAEARRIDEQNAKAAKAKPLTEEQIRALIDAVPPTKIIRCPPPKRPDFESDWERMALSRAARGPLRTA
jgi:hypothetical protein